MDGCTIAVDHYLKEIEKKKHLHSFLEVFAEEAILRAKELDEKRKLGKPVSNSSHKRHAGEYEWEQ